VKLKKTLKTVSSGQKKPKKTQKTQKKPKKPTGLGFLEKTRVFSNPDYDQAYIHLRFGQSCLKSLCCKGVLVIMVSIWIGSCLEKARLREDFDVFSINGNDFEQ
jgi:hypothetical protein